MACALRPCTDRETIEDLELQRTRQARARTEGIASCQDQTDRGGTKRTRDRLKSDERGQKHGHLSRLIDNHNSIGCGSLVRHPLASSVVLQVSRPASSNLSGD